MFYFKFTKFIIVDYAMTITIDTIGLNKINFFLSHRFSFKFTLQLLIFFDTIHVWKNRKKR